jgi:probable phosphoglycerate mutase
VESGIQFDYVYSSPLSRAHETAQIVSRGAKLPEPVILESLIERNFGVVTGKPAADIDKMCSPDIIKTNTTTYFLSPEGAETFPQLVERAKNMLEDVRARHTSGKVLLVGHGDYGKMIYAVATGKNWRDVLVDFHFGNGDLIDISRDGDVHMVKLEQFNH